MRPFLALILVTLFIGAVVALAFGIRWQWILGTPQYGSTFSPDYARHLRLDAGAVYRAMLDDLEIRLIRLPVHWDRIEPEQGTFVFDDLDWYMNEAAQRRAKVVLAIGNKVPRWPECHTPSWARQLDKAAYNEALLHTVKVIVERYRQHPALGRWQVENEALFAFGENCPAADVQLWRQEIAAVKALDPEHKVQITVSGEQEWWLPQSTMGADIIGTSMYRRVAHPGVGYFTFPIPSRWYSLQALTVAWMVDRVVISELQAEPWLLKDYRLYTVEELAELFDAKDLEQHVRYAQRTGLREISLWGVEWWYYLRQQQRPELWDTAKRIIAGE